MNVCKVCELNPCIIGRRLCKACFAKQRSFNRYKNIDKVKLQAKASYEKHKDKAIARAASYSKRNVDKVKIWNKKARTKITQQFSEWKSTLKCVECGENHVSCLEFHHIDPSRKEGLISKLVCSKKRLQEELKKCIVLCSNCHRKHHYQENKNQEYVHSKEN